MNKLEYIFVESDLWAMLIHPGDQKIVLLQDICGRQILVSGSGLHIGFAMEYIFHHKDDFGACGNCQECGKCMQHILGTGFLSNHLRMTGGGANEFHKLSEAELVQFQDVLYQAIMPRLI